MFALGLYCVLTRRDAIKTVIGLCLLENGVHLTLVSLAPELPETALFGVATEVVVTVFLLLYVIAGVRQEFGTTDTFALRSCSGERGDAATDGAGGAVSAHERAGGDDRVELAGGGVPGAVRRRRARLPRPAAAARGFCAVRWPLAAPLVVTLVWASDGAARSSSGAVLTALGQRAARRRALRPAGPGDRRRRHR